MANSGKLYWLAIKWILRYLNGTSKLDMRYEVLKDDKRGVVGYVDADFVADLDRRRSLTKYLFSVHSYVVRWKASL